MLENAHIVVSEQDGAVTVEASGSLTFSNSREFGEALIQASLTANQVTADLRGANFIDTKIVQDLGQSAVALLKRNLRLSVLVNRDAYPLKVLHVSGFQAIMDISDEQVGS